MSENIIIEDLRLGDILVFEDERGDIYLDHINNIYTNEENKLRFHCELFFQLDDGRICYYNCNMIGPRGNIKIKEVWRKIASDLCTRIWSE